MRKIFKYPFSVSDKIEINMPSEAEILSVQVQDEVPCIWAIVNTDSKIKIHTFFIYGTGQNVLGWDNGMNYIGTFQLFGGKFVGHLFDEG
jgi:hypothetical protein